MSMEQINLENMTRVFINQFQKFMRPSLKANNNKKSIKFANGAKIQVLKITNQIL